MQFFVLMLHSHRKRSQAKIQAKYEMHACNLEGSEKENATKYNRCVFVLPIRRD